MGLIETVRVREGGAPLWPLHLRRLATSCRALGIPFPEPLLPPTGGEDRLVRLEVDAAGVRVTERAVGPTSPIQVITSPLGYQPYPHKTTDRAQFDQTLAAAKARGASDGILVTPDGLVAEAAIWALLWWDGQRLCGPGLELGILPSVGRARVSEIVGGITSQRARPADLTGRSLLAVNAARGVVAIAAWDGQVVPSAPRTEELAAAFWP
jgi:branched-subunit amino acid aminotransferase/4-amino-4-deoxychorismate lyase